MPAYEVTGPDGSVYEVEAPDGATEDQIMRFVRAQVLEQQAEAERNRDPTEGMSRTELMLAGAGKAFTDLYQGGKQLALDTADKLSGMSPGITTPQLLGALTRKVLPNAGQDAQALQQQIEADKKASEPLMNNPWALAGNIGGNIAAAAPLALIPGANTYAGASLIGAGLGAVQPVGEGDSRTANVALGGAGGAVGKYAGDRVAAGVQAIRGAPASSGAQAAAGVGPSSETVENVVNMAPEMRATGGGSGFGQVGPDPSAGLSMAQTDIARIGSQMGFRQTPGQRSGSRALQQLEAKLESQPLTSGPFNKLKAWNQRVLNRAVGRAIGEEVDEVDSVVLGRADDRIGEIYRNVANDTPRKVSQADTIERLAQIEDQVEGVVSGFADHPLVNRVLDFAANGEATGRQLQSLSSKLGKVIHREMTSQGGDRDLGLALAEVKEHVDDMLGQGLEPVQQMLFADARRQYRNLMLVTSQTNVVNPSSGNVNGRALAQVLQRKDRNGFLYGRNTSDLYNAARFSQAFQPIVGDSGTATRSMLTNPLDIATAIPTNIATRMYLSRPSIMAATGATAAGNAASQAAMAGLGRLPPQAYPLLGGLAGANLAGQ